MSTVDEIIARILQPMRDSAQDYFSDAELVGYINDAIEDLASRQRLFHEEDVTCATTGGGIPYTNIGSDTDILEIRWVTNPDGIEAVWIDPSTFKIYSDVTVDADEPLASTWDEIIHLLPEPPDGENWTVGYYALPARVVAGSGAFPLPRIWERKVVSYGRAQAYYRLAEMDLGDREIGAYEAGLRPAERAFDRNAPGGITLTREANVFDTDFDSIHLGG